MRREKYRIWAVILAFSCLGLTGGCTRVPEPKTMLLPIEETEQGVALEGEEGDRYAVRKIYSREYSSLWYGGYTAFLPGMDEHRVCLAERDTEGLRIQTMDYRYGFYDTGSFAAGELMDALALPASWGWGSQDERNMEKEFFSPNGKYLLYQRGDLSHIGNKLYLLNLETEKEELLLDGDEAKRSVEDFMILTAWSRDASTLCYGFVPRNTGVWNTSKKDTLVLYYLDLKTGEVVNRLNYSYAGTAGKADDLQSARLYIDRSGDKILTALVSDSAYEKEEICIDLFLQDIPEPGMETEGVVIPQRMRCIKEALFYLDAESQRVYASYAGDMIQCIDANNAEYVEKPLELEPYKGIWDFCVLDGGQAYITAEYDRNYAEGAGVYEQDICLYTVTESGAARRVLYQNAGCVIRLQYDPVYRRILAETGEPYTIEKMEEERKNEDSYIQWDENRKILVLEF